MGTRWLRDGSVKISSPGFHTPNWILIKTPRKKDVLQAAYDVTNKTIRMLKLTIKGTPGVDPLEEGKSDYERAEQKSHEDIKAQIETVASKLKVTLQKTSLSNSFTKLEQEVSNLLRSHKAAIQSNLNEVLLKTSSLSQRVALRYLRKIRRSRRESNPQPPV